MLIYESSETNWEKEKDIGNMRQAVYIIFDVFDQIGHLSNYT